MNIALLAPLRFPIAEPYAGGLEWHTHQLARALVARGHAVTLYAHPDSDPALNVAPVAVPEDAGFITYQQAIFRAADLASREDYDVVHNNTIHFLPPLLAGNFACPVVTVLHTPPYKSQRWTSWLTKKVTNHHYISISRFLAEQWLPYVGESTVVHNGIDPAAWPFSGRAKAKTAIWYGRFTPEKGAEYAIAAARAAGYALTLAGPVSDRAYFEAKIAPELDETITYAGHIGQAELAGLIGRAAVGLVTPVWDEPFGLVFLEMLACGTPVAGFRSGAAAEIITDATGALVEKHDVQALARVLGRVVEQGKRADCRAHVLQSFRVAGMVDGYQRIYRRASGR